MGNLDITSVILAEKAILGCAMVGDTGRAVLLQLGDEDFYDPKCQLVASVMRDMIRRNVPPDMITVQAEIAARGKTHLVRSTDLYDLVTLAPPTMAAPYYAQQVRDNARVRLIHEAAQRLVKMTCSDDSVEQLGEALARHADEMAAVPAPFDVTATESNRVEQLMQEPEQAQNFIIPGLVEHGERIVITGPEGLGKSVLTRQVAGAIAAGLHPVSGERVSREGFRVLHIDAENSRAQLRRNYRILSARMPGNHAEGWAERIHLHIRPEGVNLAGKDRAWFHQVAAQCSPDLIVLGPAYKLMTGLDPNKDMDVLSLFSAIDEVRTRHDAAVLIEAHTPHGGDQGKRPVRPFGSSVWLRWPEVGFGLRVDEEQEKQVREFDRKLSKGRPRYVQVVSWRGQREDRDWPAGLTWGSDAEFPWVPSHTYLRGVA